MAFKRAHRAGQITVLPLLSDPEYRERRAARVAAVAKGDSEDAKKLREAKSQEIDAEEERFRTTLDPACLLTDLTGVCRVTLRALSGEAFAEAEEAAALASASLVDPKARAVRYSGAYIMGVLERSLIDCGVEGIPAATTGRFPLEALHGPGGIGAAWPAYSAEVFGLAHAWAHMGELVGSSCAPSSGEPT